MDLAACSQGAQTHAQICRREIRIDLLAVPSGHLSRVSNLSEELFQILLFFFVTCSSLCLTRINRSFLEQTNAKTEARENIHSQKKLSTNSRNRSSKLFRTHGSAVSRTCTGTNNPIENRLGWNANRWDKLSLNDVRKKIKTKGALESFLFCVRGKRPDR